MLPEFATDRHDDGSPRRSILTLVVTIFVTGFIVTATAITLWNPRAAQHSMCDGKYGSAARLAGDVLRWTPITNDSRYQAVVTSILAAAGLVSITCSGRSSHG
jgi:hypothetical protein